MKRLWQWWRNRKWWIRWSLSVAIATALFYFVENVRGDLAWKRCREHYAELGISLDIEDYQPKGIPASVNLAEQPWTRTFFPQSGGTPAHFYDRDQWRPKFASASQPDQKTAVARELLSSLESHSEAILLLEKSALEFEFEAPLAYPDPPGLHWDGSVIAISMEMLNYKAQAHFTLGEYDKWLRSLEALFSLIDKSSSHSAIQLLVGQICRSRISRHLDEQVPLGKLGERHLRELASLLDTYSLLDPWPTFNRERSIYLASIDALENGRLSRSRESFSFESPSQKRPVFFNRPGLPELFDIYENLFEKGAFAIYVIAPSGWFDQNRAVGCYAVDKDPMIRMEAERRRERYRPYNAIAWRFAYNPKEFLNRIYDSDRELLETRTAVALELFRRTNKEFPQSLNELLPDYLETLPADPATGLPLRYSRRGEAGDKVMKYQLTWP